MKIEYTIVLVVIAAIAFYFLYKQKPGTPDAASGGGEVLADGSVAVSVPPPTLSPASPALQPYYDIGTGAYPLGGMVIEATPLDLSGLQFVGGTSLQGQTTGVETPTQRRERLDREYAERTASSKHRLLLEEQKQFNDYRRSGGNATYAAWRAYKRLPPADWIY